MEMPDSEQMPLDMERRWKNKPAAPPENEEAERAVLGAALIDPGVIGRIIPILEDRDFYNEGRSSVYRAMVTLTERGEPVDHITVSQQLEEDGTFELAGGLSGIANLIFATPTSLHAEAHARIVADLGMKRRMASVAGRIAIKSHDPEISAGALAEIAQSDISEVIASRTTSRVQTIQDALSEILDSLNGGEQHATVPTGFYSLDRKLDGGLGRSDLILLAGRPAMGKTAMSLNVAAHVAIMASLPVMIFSLEMSTRQVAMRLLAAESRIETRRFKSLGEDEGEERRFGMALDRLAQAKIFIDDTSAVTPLTVRARAERIHEKTPLGLVVVDHAQIMSGSNGKSDNRSQEVGEIARRMKDLARDLNVPVLLLSQLNRGVEQRADKTPKLADLKESGGLEENADVVLMLYRDGYYNADTDRPGTADVLIEKHRNGETGKVELLFNERTTRFMNLDHGY